MDLGFEDIRKRKSTNKRGINKTHIHKHATYRNSTYTEKESILHWILLFYCCVCIFHCVCCVSRLLSYGWYFWVVIIIYYILSFCFCFCFIIRIYICIYTYIILFELPIFYFSYVSGGGMSVAIVCLTVPKINAMHYAATNKITPSPIVCGPGDSYRLFFISPPPDLVSSFPLDHNVSKGASCSIFFSQSGPSVRAPPKIVSAYFSPDHHTATGLSMRYQFSQVSGLIWVGQEKNVFVIMRDNVLETTKKSKGQK